ncbi:carbon-nitrogen hydrolase family protein, partial [candidate division KSB1 bacterium]|nr:carbon-nitrogen hydrolase family protein [candidate division KSB1 bacterium]
HQPDLIVLPEAVNLGPGLDLSYAEVALSLESEWMQQVSRKAAEYGAYIIFPIIEKLGDRFYNSAPVYGRTGELIGVYRKTHEPRVVIEEQQVTVGNEWPVFDLDIGRIGILICYDTILPEPALVYGLLDVDLIVFPHLIGIKSNGDQFDLRTRSRALDACVHLASSGWARPHDSGEPGPLSATCWIDFEGRVTAQAALDAADLVVVEIDLKKPRITENLGVWGKAEWKKVYWGERRPHLYRILCEDNRDWRGWAPDESY